MKQLLKRQFQLFMGTLVLILAACAPAPTQIPTIESTAIPTNTSGIPVTGSDLTNTPTPGQPTPSPTPSVPTVVNPTAATAPVTTSVNANSEERIKFAAGSTSATVTGHLDPSGSKQYLLRVLAGQTMTINLAFTQGQAILVVWGDDGNVLLSDHAEASSFQRVLPTTQDYHIQVKGRPEGSTDYRMMVSIPASNNTVAKRIAFPVGSTSATVTGQLNPSASDQYILNAQARQTMTINLTFTQGSAILVVWGADGDVLISDHAEASSFDGVLPATQDYYIMVKGRPDGFTTYNMTITVPPLP